MARSIAEVYDALKSAGADEDKARAASPVSSNSMRAWIGSMPELEARVTKLETEVAVLKWMIGANIALTILVLGKLLVP